MRMDRERIDARIDRTAEAAKEAVDLLAGRIDAAHVAPGDNTPGPETE